MAFRAETVTRDASHDEWETLVARSTRDSLEQEPIEVVEMRGLCALRRGEPEAARRELAHALSLAKQIPSLMESRIRRSLSRITSTS